MSRTFSNAVLLLVLCAPAAFGQAPRTLAQAREELKELLLDLREAKTLAGVVPDRNLRDKLEASIAKAERKAKDLESWIGNVQAAPAAPTAMSIEDFAKFQKAFKAESFDDGKLKVLEGVVKFKYFTCGQATILVKGCDFDKGRQKVAVMLYPRLVDPANFFEVLNVFDFDSNKNAVRKELGISK